AVPARAGGALRRQGRRGHGGGARRPRARRRGEPRGGDRAGESRGRAGGRQGGHRHRDGGRAGGGGAGRVGPMRSMTGFGAAAGDARAARIAVEVRGVNQRHLDVRIAVPREYAPWERELRERVRAEVERGRVDVTVARTPVARRRRYQAPVRGELAARYAEAARALGRRLRLPGSVSLADVLRLPDLFDVVERPPDLAGELPVLRVALARALRSFTRERER